MKIETEIEYAEVKTKKIQFELPIYFKHNHVGGDPNKSILRYDIIRYDENLRKRIFEISDEKYLKSHERQIEIKLEKFLLKEEALHGIKQILSRIESGSENWQLITEEECKKELEKFMYE